MIGLKLPSLVEIQDVTRPYLTIQNAGLLIAGMIALSWVWGSIDTLQRNYQHQYKIDQNKQQIAMMKLQNQNLEYQKAYYNSNEFLELEARERLGLSYPGEKMVILPSSREIRDSQAVSYGSKDATILEKSNFEKWIDFFFRSRRV